MVVTLYIEGPVVITIAVMYNDNGGSGGGNSTAGSELRPLFMLLVLLFMIFMYESLCCGAGLLHLVVGSGRQTCL